MAAQLGVGTVADHSGIDGQHIDDGMRDFFIIREMPGNPYKRFISALSDPQLNVE